jgi:pimeloyl-ACP methyl ester carboxylesterase
MSLSMQKIIYICNIILGILLCSTCCSTYKVNNMKYNYDNKYEYSKNTILNYKVKGRGETNIVFLHGFGASSLSWDDILPFFNESKFTIYNIDLKGHGLSSKAKDGKYSINDQADIIFQFIIDMSLKNIILVGHSYGGGIALLTKIKEQETMRNSTLISKMILVDSAAYKDDIPFFIKYLRVPLINKLVLKGLPINFTTEVTLKKIFYDKSKVTKKIIERYATFRNYNGIDDALIETAQNIIPEDYNNMVIKYRTIKIPILIIWGHNDPIIPLLNGRRLNKDIPNSKLLIIDKCGHVPQEEKPDETYEAIRNFIEES